LVAMTQRTYTAVYQRDPEAEAWLVSIRGFAGCQTYGKSLRQAQGRIREALALWLNVEKDSLLIRHSFPSELVTLTAEVHRAREAAAKAGAEAQAQTVGAVKAFAELGLSRRDAAELLGLSHQRVQQLAEAS
jgi:predicted RNase H-like HicB family nuclease